MSLFSRRAQNGTFDKEKPPSPNLVFHEIPLTPSMAGCWLCPAGLVFSACCLFLPARNVEPGPGAATSLSPATDRGNMRSCQLRGDLSSGILIHSFICITTLLFSPGHGGHGGHGTTCSNVTSGDTRSFFNTIDCCRSIVHVHRFTEEQRPRLLFYCDL